MECSSSSLRNDLRAVPLRNVRWALRGIFLERSRSSEAVPCLACVLRYDTGHRDTKNLKENKCEENKRKEKEADQTNYRTESKETEYSPRILIIKKSII